MEIYMIVQPLEENEGERIIAIFFNKNIAECYIDDTPSINEYKLITLTTKKEENND